MPPVAVAGVKASEMPVTGVLVIVPVVTTPSASVALSVAWPAVPRSTLRLAGQLATTGWFAGGGQGLVVTALLRGAGASLAKSAALLSLSVQPSAARSAAVLLVSVGEVGPAPSKLVASAP